MLTAQAQNQDPLEPMDSSQYASQLAQFSMVEQQVQTNDLLSALATAMGSVKLDELASWVGMDVRTTSGFHFDGAPGDGVCATRPGCGQGCTGDPRQDGTEIDRVTVPASNREYAWAGTDSAGNPLPAGTYSATLESYQNDKDCSRNNLSLPTIAWSKRRLGTSPYF